MAEFRAGLWKKIGRSGTKFCSGKIKIGTQEFQVVLFNNDKRGNDKAPDFNLILRDEEIKEQPKEEIDPFKAFGDKIEQEDLPF